MEVNNRKLETMNAITFIASATTSNRDTYPKLSGMVVALISELVIENKNLVEVLNENTRLKCLLSQSEKITLRTGGGGANGRGGPYNHKKGNTTAGHRVMI